MDVPAACTTRARYRTTGNSSPSLTHAEGREEVDTAAHNAYAEERHVRGHGVMR
jgi:hypothetical protein